MSDLVDDYRKKVVKLLSPVKDEPHSRLAEVLCLPSSHPEVLLQVTDGPSGCTFRLVTCTSSLWYSLSEPGRWPGRAEESALVPPKRAARFWAVIDALNPQAIGDSAAVGLDGMFTQCSWRRGEASVSFEAWSPAPDSRHGTFIRRIYDLAWELAQERASVERLEQIHGYLHIGLPVRQIVGKVRCLRIFGRLSSRDEDQLRSHFASLPREEPVVVDMTNFDGMGTFLYPAFVEFASGRRVAWALSSTARRQVESMGLNEPELFDRAEDAVEWTVRTGARRASDSADPSDHGQDSSPT